MKTSAKCKKHTRYMGVYKPQTGCKKCARIYATTHPYQAAKLANENVELDRIITKDAALDMIDADDCTEAACANCTGNCHEAEVTRDEFYPDA